MLEEKDLQKLDGIANCFIRLKTELSMLANSLEVSLIKKLQEAHYEKFNS